mgnify:CR=1 FL=1
MSTKKGNLYLIPCPLGDVFPLEVLPLSVKNAIEKIDHYIVEHDKNARRFIKSIVPEKQQSALKIQEINKFTNESEIPSMLNPCLEGFDVGTISDAGCPGIADPGATCASRPPAGRRCALHDGRAHGEQGAGQGDRRH